MKPAGRPEAFSLPGLGNASLCENFQLCTIFIDQGNFLGVCPSLELALAGDGIVFRRMCFLINKRYGTAAGGPQRAATLVVNLYSFLDVCSVPDIKAAVGTTNNIDEGGIT